MSLGGDLVTGLLDTPDSTVSLRSDPVTDHLDTPVPVGTLRSEHLDGNTLWSYPLTFCVLRLDTLDVPPDSGCFNNLIPIDFTTPG